MAQTMKIKKGDVVQILSGKDRGKQGRVIEAVPSDQKVVVQNLNMVKRHQKPRPLRDSSRMGGPTIQPGGVIEKEAALPVGNVMVVCPVCKRPTRIGTHVRVVKGETVRIRHCKREDCGQEIDR